MTIEGGVRQLVNELINTPFEKHFHLIKHFLDNIEDARDRAKAESYIESGMVFGYQSLFPKKIVVLVHGIRTNGAWQGVIEDKLDSYDYVKVFPIGYGFFDGLKFWFPYLFRNGPIKRIQKELRNIIADHKNDEVSVVAHSFGTYIMTETLRECSDIRIHSLLLCGSIVKNDYDWDSLSNLPKHLVLNDVGVKDIWPILAKSFSWGYGNTGTIGFQTNKVKDRFHDFTHSDFFSKEFVDNYWVPFLVFDEYVQSSYTKNRSNAPYKYLFLSSVPFQNIIVGMIFIAIYIYFS